ncbi:hypothetical protein Hanom_Chr15g01337641 [Helianthus anomalus]
MCLIAEWRGAVGWGFGCEFLFVSLGFLGWGMVWDPQIFRLSVESIDGKVGKWVGGYLGIAEIRSTSCAWVVFWLLQLFFRTLCCVLEYVLFISWWYRLCLTLLISLFFLEYSINSADGFWALGCLRLGISLHMGDIRLEQIFVCRSVILRLGKRPVCVVFFRSLWINLHEFRGGGIFYGVSGEIRALKAEWVVISLNTLHPRTAFIFHSALSFFLGNLILFSWFVVSLKGSLTILTTSAFVLGSLGFMVPWGGTCQGDIRMEIAIEIRTLISTPNFFCTFIELIGGNQSLHLWFLSKLFSWFEALLFFFLNPFGFFGFWGNMGWNGGIRGWGYYGNKINMELLFIVGRRSSSRGMNTCKYKVCISDDMDDGVKQTIKVWRFMRSSLECIEINVWEGYFGNIGKFDDVGQVQIVGCKRWNQCKYKGTDRFLQWIRQCLDGLNEWTEKVLCLCGVWVRPILKLLNAARPNENTKVVKDQYWLGAKYKLVVTDLAVGGYIDKGINWLFFNMNRIIMLGRVIGWRFCRRKVQRNCQNFRNKNHVKLTYLSSDKAGLWIESWTKMMRYRRKYGLCIKVVCWIFVWEGYCRYFGNSEVARQLEMFSCRKWWRWKHKNTALFICWTRWCLNGLYGKLEMNKTQSIHINPWKWSWAFLVRLILLANSRCLAAENGRIEEAVNTIACYLGDRGILGILEIKMLGFKWNHDDFLKSVWWLNCLVRWILNWSGQMNWVSAKWAHLGIQKFNWSWANLWLLVIWATGMGNEDMGIGYTKRKWMVYYLGRNFCDREVWPKSHCLLRICGLSKKSSDGRRVSMSFRNFLVKFWVYVMGLCWPVGFRFGHSFFV